MRSLKARNPKLKDKENQKPGKPTDQPSKTRKVLKFDYLRASQGFKEVQKKLHGAKKSRKNRGAKKHELPTLISNQPNHCNPLLKPDYKTRKPSQQHQPAVRKGQMEAQLRLSKERRFKDLQNKEQKKLKPKPPKFKAKDMLKLRLKPKEKRLEDSKSSKHSKNSKKLRRLSSYQSSKSIFGNASHHVGRRASDHSGNLKNKKLGYKRNAVKKQKNENSRASNDSRVFNSKKRKKSVHKNPKQKSNESPIWKKGNPKKQALGRMKLSMANMSLANNTLRPANKALLSCRNNRRSVFFPEKLTTKLENARKLSAVNNNDHQTAKNAHFGIENGRRPVTSIHHLATLLESKPDRFGTQKNIFDNIESNTSIMFGQNNKDHHQNQARPDYSQNLEEYGAMQSNRSFLLSQNNNNRGNSIHDKINNKNNNSRLLAKKLAPGPKKRKKIFSFNKEKEDLFKNNMIGIESQVFGLDSKKNDSQRTKNSFLCLQSKLGTSVFDSMKMAESKKTRNNSSDTRDKFDLPNINNDYTKIENPFDLDEYRNKHLKDITKDFINLANKKNPNVSFLRAIDSKNDAKDLEDSDNPKNIDSENLQPNEPIFKRPKRANFLERIKKMRNLSSLHIASSDMSGKPHTHRPKKSNLQQHFEVARDIVQKNRLLKKNRALGGNVSMNFALKDPNTEIQNISLNIDPGQKNLQNNFEKPTRDFNRHTRVSSNHVGAQSGIEHAKKNILHRKTPSLNLNFVPGFGHGLHELLNGNKNISQRVISGFQENYDANSLHSFERDMLGINGITQKIAKPVSTISGNPRQNFLILSFFIRIGRILMIKKIFKNY